MKKLISALLLFFLSLPALAQASSAELTKAQAEIAPLFTAMFAAANALDAEKHMAYYAKEPTLTFVYNDTLIVGFDNVLAQQREWFTLGDWKLAFEQVGAVDYKLVAPNLVMQTFFLKSRLTNDAKKELRFSLGISNLWQKRPEGWRVIYCHESSKQL